MTIKAITFDFFGVICSEVAPVWLPRHLPPERAASVKAELVGAADRGDIPDSALFDRLSVLTGNNAAQIEREWDALAVVDQRVVEVARLLGERYPIGLLTNAPSGFVRRVLAANNLTGLFKSVIVSSEERCAKPDQRIFEVLLRSLGVAAGETLFIDDNPVNVQAAMSMGMSGIVFRSLEDLRSVLAEMGVLS